MTKKAETMSKNIPAIVNEEKPTNNALPAYLQGHAPAKLEGIEASDLVLPRLKLLQAISPEVEQYDEARAGNFWHNVLGISLGPQFDFIVATFRKKYLLMAPLGSAKPVLARAEDGVNWTPANESFKVKLKGVKEEQTWTTTPTVRESGLAEYGSSIAGDPDSKPAAVLIYEFLVYLPEHPELSPVVMSLARSQIRKGKDLLSKITFRQQPLNAMRFQATVIEETGDEGLYKNYQFASNGFATEAEFNRVKGLAEQFGTYKVADEEGVAGDVEPSSGEKAAPSKEY